MAALRRDTSHRFLNELLLRRQVRCCILHLFFSSTAIISWCSVVWLRAGFSKWFAAFFSVHTWLGLLIFWSSGLFFVIAELLLSEPECTPWPNFIDVWDAIRPGARRLNSGKVESKQKDAPSGVPLSKVKALFLRAAFFPLLLVSGALGFVSYLYILRFPVFHHWMPSTSHVSLREILGIATMTSVPYGLQHLYRREWVISFPIIQRVFWFRLKAAFHNAACLSIIINILTAVCTETLVLLICLSTRFSSGLCTVSQAVVLFMGGTLLAFCWESGRQIFEVVLTERQAFILPPGSMTSENSSCALLLSALDFNTHKNHLVEHLAFLDLCCISEQNVDSGRRAALFEETGETYRRVIDLSLSRVDSLTNRLKTYMEHGQKGAEQRQTGTAHKIGQVFDGAQQLTFWSIKISSSLTAMSRIEDLYGVAQLSGCNSKVLYSLVSCLLAVEAAIAGTRGRSSGASYGSTSHWSKLAGIDIGMGVKGSGTVRPVAMYEQAYATADVLRSAIYSVVFAFNEELAPLQHGGALSEISVGSDWLNAGKPLFGTKGMHFDKLKSFLDCQA